jgi:hypothetical protein
LRILSQDDDVVISQRKIKEILSNEVFVLTGTEYRYGTGKTVRLGYWFEFS